MITPKISSVSPIGLATPRNDRGMQDLLGALGADPAHQAANALANERQPIVICTGFPVKGSPETDGPPGTFALVDALRSLGKSVKIASWHQALQVFQRVRPDVQAIKVPVSHDGSIEPVSQCAVVTVEACGLCGDGTYRNMRGADISDSAPRFEDVFGTTSLVSFGDGGNEYGFGSAPQWFFAQRNVRQPISHTQHLVPASVSNYGVYATIRELEGLSGRKLLPESEDHLALIRALVEAGCVDGYTGERIFSVDGSDLQETRQILDTIRRAPCQKSSAI
jgi:hypothetical protein